MKSTLVCLAAILFPVACSSTTQRSDAAVSLADAITDVLSDDDASANREVTADAGPTREVAHDANANREVTTDAASDMASEAADLEGTGFDAYVETNSAIDSETNTPSDAGLSGALSLLGGSLVYRRGDLSLALVPSCPVITIDGVVFSSTSPSVVTATTASGNRFEYACSMSGDNQNALLVTVVYEVSEKDGNLRKWATILPSGFSKPATLQKVILEILDTGSYGPAQLTDLGNALQSFPALFDNFFAGIEYPIAQTYLDQGNVVLSHRPGQSVTNGQLLSTRTAVFGLSPPGQAHQFFDDYVATIRPKSAGIHLTYDTWWTLPFPSYNEQNVLDLLSTLKNDLSTPYGVSFDSFCLDLGWNAPQGIWEISQDRLPNGLANIKTMADSMHTALGLWFSPSNLYSPASFDNVWASQNGYEAGPSPLDPSMLSLCTVKGGKYLQRLKEVFLEYINKYKIGMLKVDGMVFTCDQTDHGHPTGGYETEFIADGMIDFFRAALQANPDLWIEATCFTPNPSPFWLLYVSSVLGAYGDGDDSPPGLIPAPSYRESYTTARDHSNLQGSDRLAAPVRYQDVLGLIHQTTDDFTNDAIMSVIRGNDFLAVYANPTAGMTAGRWAKLASILQWARGAQATMQRTQTLRPHSWSDLNATSLYEKDTMPREPYGYAHWAADGGLIGLRNPWMARASYTVQVPPGTGHWYATSLYPEERIYGEVDQGGSLEVSLAPYETLVLSLSAQASKSDLPTVAGGANGPLVVLSNDFSTAPVSTGVAYTLNSSVQSAAEETTLMLVFDDNQDFTLPNDIVIAVNNASVSYQTASSDGWVAAPPRPRPEVWNIVSADIPAGTQSIGVSFTRPFPATGDVSGWLLASKAAKPTQTATSLPQPETIYLDSVQLF